jgi:hypothetical protein
MRHSTRKVRAKVAAIPAVAQRRRSLAAIALPVVVAATVAAAGLATPADASLARLGSAPAAVPARGEMQSVPQSRTIIIRLVRRVDAAKLPKPKITNPEAEPVETSPKHLKPRSTGIVTMVLRGKGGSARNRPDNPAISQGISVTGLQDGGPIPPDTQVAAGGTKGQWIVEMVNHAGAVYSNSGAQLNSFDLGALFFGVAGTGGDPKVVYDRASGDFFASFLRFRIGGTNKSQINLAVSSNPLGSWSVYTVSVENLLQDQPKLGFSSDKLVMSWNQNGNSGPEQYMAIQKSGVVALASSVPAVIWNPDSSRLNVIPAVQVTSGGTAFAIFHNYNSSSIGVMAFTGVPGVSPVSFTQAVRGVASTTSPPGGLQPGASSPRLATGDDRLESAVWSNGNLWAAGNDACKYRSDSATRACLRVVHVSTASMTVLRDVDITLVGGSLMYPAVVVDSEGNLWLSFSASSPSLFASAAIAEAPGGTIGSSIGGIIDKSGSGEMDYSSCTKPPGQRFGDYSGIAADPVRLGVWAAAEDGALAKQSCFWSTQVAQFTP